MMFVVWLLLTICSSLLCIPVLVLLIEVAACVLLRRRRQPRNSSTRPCVAVLIPAHNEGSGLLPTLRDVRSQLHAGDRLLVVADNCSDDTAAVAKDGGSEVIERNDPDRIGKGFALDYGLRHLSAEPPEIVIVIDADCRIDAHSIDLLAQECARTCRPVQSLYLMTRSESAPVNQSVAEFAWRLKNWVRPLGLLSLNMPCQLMGTGMAFPWAVIWSADLASGEVVEDLRLGLELAAVGKAPVFCPAARVTSVFPSSIEAARNQRERWEGGQIRIIIKTAPKMLLAAVEQRNLGLLVLVFDLLIPPLTILVILLMLDLFCTIIAFFALSQATPLFLSLCNLFALSAALLIAWNKFGRDILGSAQLSLLPKYGLEKIRLYIRLYFRKGSPLWVRTERDRSKEIE
jgi:cellulose synthase/poly-beta-1,6-N-acetylglucosamine synthase-like glycosyltransferase